jgi:flagellar biosynthesis protein FliP
MGKNKEDNIMRKASSIKNQLRQIILQGNNDEIQELFKEIVKASQETFHEDSDITLACFLVSNLYNGFEIPNRVSMVCIKDAMKNELEENYLKSISVG